ncbi:MAG: ABC transporter ATP-binding protein [Frankiaceae bacterium]|nr:ABC transporter ATP-binding protein [Frankiaceae bacterium]
MSEEPRVVVDHVSKRYVKYDDAPMLVTRALRWGQRSSRSELWALRDIDFTVATGECVGVIGHNGSGKSTLLRLLAGVTGPTRGRVKVRGRIAPLISVGVGFHQELTGRENVHANGTILGLSRSQIEDRLPDIIDFASIDDFIDTPVKFYSSGMYMRLGFAVSVLAAPDVLLVDEVLAVGDFAFQMKCLDRMMEIKESGTTIVIVSHNLGAIRRMCDRTIVLHKGELRYNGDTARAITVFHELLSGATDGEDLQDPAYRVMAADPGEIESFELIGPSGEPTRTVSSQDRVQLRLDVRFRKPTRDVRVGVMVWDEFASLYEDMSAKESARAFEAGDRVRVSVEFRPSLRSGSYMARVALVQDDGVVAAEPFAIDFFVTSPPQTQGGLIDVAATMSMAELAPVAKPTEVTDGD